MVKAHHGHDRQAAPRMSKQHTFPPVRVVWHGPINSHNQTSGRNIEFFVFADADTVEKWRKDKTIPLVEVVANFEILEVTNGGNTGLYTRPSQQALAAAFDTTDEVQIITRILSEGKIMRSGAQRHQSKDEYDKLAGPPHNYSKGAYKGRTSQHIGHQGMAVVHK